MANEVISRDDARAQGLKSYFSGLPCRNGHFARRSVKHGNCLECSVQKTRSYRKKHPGWAAKVGKSWNAKNREKRRAQARTRYAKDPAKFVNMTKRYYRANAEKVKAARRIYHYKKQKCLDYRVSAVNRTTQWAKDNPEKRRAQLLKQKAKRRLAKGSHTGADLMEILRLQKGRCAYCRTKLTKYQVDHIMALAKGGTNLRNNLQMACAPCNRAKSDKDPLDFARSLGMLL
jgi:5-methylcytosine-specific restriction endonuclease McrA